MARPRISYMGKKQVLLHLSIVLILSAAFVFLFYGKVLLSPNQYMFSAKGDAIKNYYTYSYYIGNNQSNINFEGFNYPYGEHFLYTDCTPLLSAPLRFINNYFPFLSNYSIGILNFMLIISFVFSSLLIYLILKEFKVNTYLSMAASLGIMALSPQIFRLYGHLALGFGFVIPLVWYLLLKYENNNHAKKYAAYLFVSVLLTFFIHAYLGMIVAAFLFAYLVVRFFFDIKTNSINWKYYFSLLTVVFSPIILFRLFLFFTDTHTGRTDNPWGFFFARADYNTIFFPNQKPLKPLFETIFGQYNGTWEGWAYIGIGSLAILLFYFILISRDSIKNRKLVFGEKWFDNRHLQIAILASALLLLFSMALPFRMYLRWLLDYMPVLKQFRAVGRFAWVFYFVVTVSSVYIIDKLSKHYFKANKNIIAVTIMILLPLSYFAEAWPYHANASKNIVESPNLFRLNQLRPELRKGIEKIVANDYQAILPMPFFYKGSENYGKDGTDKIYLLSQLISFHTDLPILGSYLTRTSIWESKNIMQIISPGFYKKNIVGDIKSNKPFLIVFSKEQLSTYEQRIIDMAKLIFETEDYKLYSLSKENLFRDTRQQELDDFYTLKDKLHKRGAFLTTDTVNYLYFNDFEQNPSEIKLNGNGAFSGWMKNDNKLAGIEKGLLDFNKKYIASFWMYNMGPNFGQDMLTTKFKLWETINGNTEWTTMVRPINSITINGDWSLVEMEFKLKNPEAQIDFILEADNLSKMPVFIDDFMIYEKKSLNYSADYVNDTTINLLKKNNQQIKLAQQ